MSISDIFILRPKGATILAAGVAIFGLVAFKFLPVAPLPQVEYPTINVSAALPGASPETMATSVATPLEKQLGQIAGVTELTSSSKLGSTRITVQFDLSRDINGAARDVQAAIIAARRNLPITLPAQPSYRIVNPADAPIMVIALTSEIYDRGRMYDVASSVLQQKLSQVDGVGQVIVGGGALPAVRIELNPDALNQYGLGLIDVASTLKLTNITQPKGFIDTDRHFYTLATNDQVFTAKDYKPLILSYKNNDYVRLQDVAEVVDSVEDIRNTGGADGQPAVVLIIFKEPGSNVIETVERLYAALDSMKAAVPAAINLTVTMDRTTTIRASLRDVEFTLLLSILLVVGVIYIFLNSARTAIIPGVVVPLTILGTFGIMYLLGFTLDNLSLIALTIVTGFVVDDAVVVLENIERNLERGLSSFKAAMVGAREVAFTVLSMSVSLIVVFMPILLMGGMVGRLFREFALTIAIAIFVSMVISLTITPMMSSKILSAKDAHHQSWRRELFEWLNGHYKRSLLWALRRQIFMLAITGLTLLVNIVLFIHIPKGFFPLQDTGRLSCSIQTEQDMSFISLEQKFKQIMDIIKEDPAVQHLAGYAGGANAIGNAGSLYVTLKPLEERDATVFQVIDRLRKDLRGITGVTLYMQAAQDLVIGGRASDAMFQYTLSTASIDTLSKWTPQVQEALKGIPGIVDLSSDQKSSGLESYVTYDRNRAGELGISVDQIDATLYAAFGQSQISTLYTPINQYHVVMEVAPKYWHHPETLKKIYVPNTTGAMVPLSSLASFADARTFILVTHQGQFPAATLSFNLSSGHALGEVVDGINKAVDTIGLPSDMQPTFQGTAQAFQKSLQSQPYLILGALIVVYIVLGILYESLIHPITILSTLPSAGVGALLALMFTVNELSIIGIIGIIMLIGIVKKNAIMMIDFALDIQRKGQKSSLSAIYKACILRFRPIMMTTFAALFGAIPLALQSGVGSELRKPLGISIMGGLILSQMLTLYTTPVVYLAMEKVSVRIKGLWHRLTRGWLVTDRGTDHETI